MHIRLVLGIEFQNLHEKVSAPEKPAGILQPTTIRPGPAAGEHNREYRDCGIGLRRQWALFQGEVFCAGERGERGEMDKEKEKKNWQ